MLSIEAKTTGPIRKKNLPLIPYGVEGDWLGLEGVRGGGEGLGVGRRGSGDGRG